ncbi:MAG: polysaccharide biosynthesis/export family protein [Deltaproteobacteria bacterium]|nr:polysaccharide biosynthesis/export family protein [Deltaproteobacteria bacterium]
MIRTLFSAALAILLGTATALGATQAASQELGEYRIGPEDVLDIAVWKNAELTRSVPVRPDGMISLPLVNDVRAAGLTPLELRDVLTKKLEEYIPSPQVSVVVSAVRSFKVSVLGEVSYAGRNELHSGATVLDALALSGGLKEFAARSRIVVLRPEGKSMKRLPFNYNKVVAGGGEAENFFLQPGDIILVP